MCLRLLLQINWVCCLCDCSESTASFAFVFAVFNEPVPSCLHLLLGRGGVGGFVVDHRPTDGQAMQCAALGQGRKGSSGRIQAGFTKASE